VSIRRLQRRHWLLAATGTGAAYVIGWPSWLVVFVGALVMSLVVQAYAVTTGSLVHGRQGRLAIGFLFVKLSALGVLAWLTLVKGWNIPDPLALAAGVVFFTIAAVWESQSTRESFDGT
jgi:hypothetical protein